MQAIDVWNVVNADGRSFGFAGRKPHGARTLKSLRIGCPVSRAAHAFVSMTTRRGTRKVIMNDAKFSLTINEATYNELRKRLLAAVKSVTFERDIKINSADDATTETFVAVEMAIKQSRVPTLKTKARSKSSAMNPAPGTIWAIGSFGSVWLDISISDDIWRIAFNPNDGLFYVDKM